MKKKILLIASLFFLLPFTIHAQNTNVSATVTDSGSVVWANGTFTFNFIPNPRFQNGPYFNNGAPFTPTSVSGSLNGSGAYTQAVPSNSTITPSGTQWTVTYCPQATAPCQTSSPITITGASQTITSNFTPSALIVAPGSQNLVYNTNEVPVASLGSQVYLIGTGLQICNAVTGTSCTTWASSGGSSSLNTLIDLAASPYSVKTGIIVNDATWTSTLFTVQSTAQANFTNSMVGWVIFGTPSCGSLLTNQLPTLPRGIVQSVQSTTSLTTNVAATGTVSGNGCLLMGPLADTGLTAADNAALAAPDCSTFLLPQGAVFVEKPHFNTKPASCDGSKVEAQGGPEVFGWGRDISRIVMTPSFNYALCTGGSGNVCWGGLLGMLWKDFSIFGGYNSQLGSTTNKILIQTNTAAIFSDFICSGIGAFDGNLIGLQDAGGEAIFHNLVLNGCGSTAFDEEGTPSGIHKIDGASLGNSNSGAVKVGTGDTLHTYGMRMGGVSSGVGIVNVQVGAQWWSFGDTCDNVAATTNVCVDNNGGTAYIDGLRCDMSTTATGTCILNDANTPTTIIANSWTKSGASGNDLNRLNGTIVDAGGNTYSTARFSGLAAGFTGESNSVNNVAVTAAKLILSGGWGSTAAVTAPNGGDSPIGFTVTNSGTGQGASPTITYTFPTPYPIAPFSCSALQVGGTNATGTFTTSALTATGVTFTFSLTPTASSTEIVQVTCVTP